MQREDDHRETKAKSRAVNRRNLLLAVSTIAAVSAIGSTPSIRTAQAQQPAQVQQPAPAQPAGRRPNILVRPKQASGAIRPESRVLADNTGIEARVRHLLSVSLRS
jgi:hypothetical protein